MSELLNWMGNHPFLTFILVFMVCATLVDVAKYIGLGMAGKHDRCQCSQPTTQVDKAEGKK